MALFKAFSPNVEVNGETVYAIVDGMGVFKSQALQFLKEEGIVDPKPGQWYSQQAWLNAFRKISEKTGANALRNIGRKIPENAQFPPQIDSIDKALGAIDMAYHMNHRGGEIGHYNFKLVGDGKAAMVCNNPYPDEFDFGLIEAMANRFKPAGKAVKMIIDQKRPTRTGGADSTTYLIKWE